jgi:hypothetical protein
MASLYYVAAEYRAQLAQLADLDLPPEVVADTIEGLSGDIENKLRAVIAYALEQDVLAVGTEEAAKRTAALAKARRARVDALFDYALTHMRECGISAVSTDEFDAKVAKKPAAVDITDAALIPPAFMRTPEPPPAAPDKRAIGDALKAGALVPGCALVQGYRLALK